MSWNNKPKKVAYVIWKGRQTGLVETWAECDALVHGYPGARYVGFTDWDEAVDAWEKGFEAYEAKRLKGLRKMWKTEPVMAHKPKTGKGPDPYTERVSMLMSTKESGYVTTCSAVNCTYPKCKC